MKISRFIIVIFILFFTDSIFSQATKRHFRQHEAGIFIGGSYYIGDLNPRKQFNFTQPAVGIFYRFSPNYRYAFRAGFNYGTIMGDDSQSEDADQLQRNLNFKSNIAEFHSVGEFNFLEYRISTDKYKFTTYLFLGFSVYKFNPKAQINNEWIELQPLQTEGQNKKYRLTQVSIPFGIGAKINVSKKVGLGLEWGPRKTFTDYLDDVSGTYTSKEPVNTLAQVLADRSKNAGSNINEQRGNPRTKDWYIFFGLSLNIKLTLKAPPCYSYD